MNIDLSPEFCDLPCRVLMNKIPPKALATEKLVDLTNRLLSIDYKAVIVYEDNDPIGLVTLKDIMRWLVQAHQRSGAVCSWRRRRWWRVAVPSWDWSRWFDL